MFVAGSSLTAVNHLANDSINRLNYWLTVNKLNLNIDKTCYMVFPSDTSNSARLILDGQEIKKVNNCRYLGVTVDDELKWTEHIDYIHSKLLKYTSIFSKLRAKIA